MKRETIANILAMITETYQGKFRTTVHTGRIWMKLLKDISDKAALASTAHLCSQPTEWPPTAGQIRHKAFDIESGSVVSRGPEDSWLMVLEYIEGKESKDSFSDLELAALKTVGSTWGVKHSESPEILRAQYIKTLDRLTRRRIEEERILGEVKGVATEFLSLSEPQEPQKLGEQEDAQIGIGEEKNASESNLEAFKVKELCRLVGSGLSEEETKDRISEICGDKKVGESNCIDNGSVASK